MTRRALLGIAVLLTALLFWIPASQGIVDVYDIACEGTESAGGGATRYQYTLRNTDTQVARSLDLFYLGTMDLNLANYSNWVMPGGWSAQVISWAAPPPGLNVTATPAVKTSHGVLPPPPPGQTLGAVVFSGPPISVPTLGTVTFGFDNPYSSWDVQWIAEGASAPPNDEISIASSVAPIAGPLGVFTKGYVHGPSLENGIVPEPGLVVLLGFGAGFILLRRR